VLFCMPQPARAFEGPFQPANINDKEWWTKPWDHRVQTIQRPESEFKDHTMSVNDMGGTPETDNQRDIAKSLGRIRKFRDQTRFRVLELRSIADIARDAGCTAGNVSYWLKKHGLLPHRNGVALGRGGASCQRPDGNHRKKEWLYEQYVTLGRSAREIALGEGLHENAVIYWLTKHGIQRRSTSEARKVKHWGCPGESNPMFGVRGAASKNWKGGVTPERQRVYSSAEWAVAIKAVWERDQGRCTDCGKEANGRKMHAHHIEGFDARPDLRCDQNNLRLLCAKCHAKYHPRKRTKGGDSADK